MKNVTTAADLRPEIIEAYREAKANGESNADLAARLGITTNVLTRVGIRETLPKAEAKRYGDAAKAAGTDEGREAFAKLLATGRYVELRSIPYLSVASGVSDGAVRTLLESVAEPTGTPEDSRVGYAILAARRTAKAKAKPEAEAKAEAKPEPKRARKAKAAGKKLAKGEVA